MQFGRSSVVAGLLAVLCLAPAAGSPQRLRPCKGNPYQVAGCFKIHGMLYDTNGTPWERIWRVGTKRVLGVSIHEGVQRMPEWLERKLSWDVRIFGDFEVCPFTKEEPDAMQMVCIESPSNVVVQDLKAQKVYRLKNH